jgi:hypothetical protein
MEEENWDIHVTISNTPPPPDQDNLIENLLPTQNQKDDTNMPAKKRICFKCYKETDHLQAQCPLRSIDYKSRSAFKKNNPSFAFIDRMRKNMNYRANKNKRKRDNRQQPHHHHL